MNDEMTFKEFIKKWFRSTFFIFCLLCSAAIAGAPIILGIILGTFVNSMLLHLIWLIIFTLPIGVWLGIRTVSKLEIIFFE